MALTVPFQACTVNADNETFREDFVTLEGWEALTFSRIEEHSLYSVTKIQDRTVLKAEADASASGLISTNIFNPYETPILRWRWRVENVLPDYKKAFGEKPPVRARLAVMSDADNTGGKVTAFLDFIEIAPPPKKKAGRLNEK